MFIKTLFAASLATSAIAGFNPATPEQRAAVKTWDAQMQQAGYDYEVHETSTDDDWQLTLFRIIPRVDPWYPNGRAILFQHGGGMDAAMWVSDSPTAQPEEDWNDLAAFFKLSDEGYDVWFGNNRATQYSNTNYRYPDADKNNGQSYTYPDQFAEKYNVSWQEMGAFDVPAMLDKVTEVSESDKVSWVGYSQGTSQMFYSLASDEGRISDKLDRAIMLAPCLYTKPWNDAAAHQKLFGAMRHEGVYLLNDPLVQVSESKLCRKVETWEKYTQEDYDTACFIFKMFTGWGPWPIKSMDQYGQNGLTGRFQEFVKDFGPENMEGPLVSPGLGAINEVPILMLVPEKDESCTVELAQQAADEIGDAVKSFRVLKDATHEYFWDATKSDAMLEELRSALESDVSGEDEVFAAFERLHRLYEALNDLFALDSASYSHIATVSAAAIAGLATTF